MFLSLNSSAASRLILQTAAATCTTEPCFVFTGSKDMMQTEGFFVAGAKPCNGLLLHVRQAHSLAVFKFLALDPELENFVPSVLFLIFLFVLFLSLTSVDYI